MIQISERELEGIIEGSDSLPNENNIDYLWEELNIYLKNDPDYRVKNIVNNTLNIHCLNDRAFNDIKIMEKIFGRIIFSDCRLNLEKKTIRAKNPANDKKVLNFKLILEKGVQYQGTIIIKK